MVVVLYIFGVSSIKAFALPLMIGIICGAYSSICITGPLWFDLKNAGNRQVVGEVKVANKVVDSDIGNDVDGDPNTIKPIKKKKKKRRYK